MLDEALMLEILLILKEKGRGDLMEYIEKLVHRAYPETIDTDDDDEYSDSEGSACSEEHYGYSVDDEGHHSLK